MRWRRMGWLTLGLASLIVSGFAVVSQLTAGAINQGPAALTALAVVVPAIAFAADRSGQPWGRGIGVTFAVLLAGLGVLWEWFAWIGDFQGYSYQKLDAALIGALVAALAAAGAYALGAARPRIGPLLGAVAAVVVVPALIGQAMVTAGRYEPPTGPAPTPSAPSVVRERAALPSCGDDSLGPDDEPMNPEAHECLLLAYREGRTAELRIDRKAEDGQPVTDIIRVLDDGTVEVFRAIGASATSKNGGTPCLVYPRSEIRPTVTCVDLAGACSRPLPWLSPWSWCRRSLWRRRSATG